MYGVLYWRDVRTYGDLEHSPALIDAKQKGLKLEINLLLLSIPTLFDIIASSLLFIALTMTAASICQMMGGLQVFFVAIMSVIFFKRKYYRHHWTSLSFVVIGAVVVGASPILYPDNNIEDATSSNPIFGVILLTISQIFAAGMVIVEEKLLGDYYLHPLKVVGWEGFWGWVIYIILLLILQFIPCSSKDICPYGTLEDTPEAFYGMAKNNLIILFIIGSILTILKFLVLYN